MQNNKIRRAFEPAGLELPTYENSCGCAVATIKRENFIKMKAGINDTKVVIDNVIENVIETASTLAKKIGVSSRTIARDLDAMKKPGIIEHVGPDKGGYWKVLIKK